MKDMVKKFWKKANSLLLAATLTVSLTPTQMAAAVGMDDTAESAITQQAQRRDNNVDFLDLESITDKEYTVIEGNTPVFPKKVNVTGDDGIMAPVTIQWSDWDKDLAAGKHNMTGTVGKDKITVTVNVLPCDEAVADVTATGLKDGSSQQKLDAIHALKGYKGLFVAEYDIVPEDVKPTHDRAVIYLPEKANDGSALHAENCWDTGARLQFKYSRNNITYFQTQVGDGQVVDNAKYFPTNQELDEAIDKGEKVDALSFDEVSTYHVRIVMDTVTDKTKGNYKIYITDPEGIEHEVTQPGGNGFRIYPKDGIIKNFAAVRGSYQMKNHKISWISGYATKKVETYLKASDAADYVKESEDVVTKELPGAMTQQPDTEIVKDNQTYTLDTEKSGWYKGEEKVTSVTAQEGETVTYRAYYQVIPQTEDETLAAKKEMENAVTAAEQKIKEINKADYTPASWSALEEALNACKTLNPETATKVDYDAKKKALERAVEGLTKLADKNALNQAIADAKAKKEADYKEGFKEMKEKLAAAETVAANPNATQLEVNLVKEDLLDAIGKLVEKVKVKSVKAAAKSYKIAAGKKLDLKKIFTVSPKNADNKRLTYSLSKKDKNYASIKSGVVTVKKAGKTVSVKATAADKSGKSAAIKIKIMKHAVTKITIKKKSLSVKAGRKVTLKPVVKTSGKSANKTLEYTSSNQKLATVKKGVVTTKKGKKGKVTITIKSTDGTNKSVKVKINIKK